MNNLWWKTIGTGNYHLVLLHGWGMNAQVWNNISVLLASCFTLHLVDLPGFGRSIGFGAMTLDKMAEYVIKQAPDKAIWLGWSLGGLVASQIALMYPNRVHALVTVASSPRFSAQKTWPGIKPELLIEFQQQLKKDFQRTIERFLALKTIGENLSRKKIRAIKNSVFALLTLEIPVLDGSLEILKTVDLREPLANLTTPHLRIYGALDGLVPCTIVPILDNCWPNSKSLIINKAAHAPFLSHPNQFYQSLINFIHWIDSYLS